MDVVGSAAFASGPAQLVVLPGVESTGAGTVIIGLKPPPSSSVAPSGIVPLATLDGEPDSGEAVPVDVTFVPDVQLEAAEIVPANPPPSNVEPELVEPVADVPCMDGPLGTQAPSGLNPPVSISVAPSGTPVPLAALAPSMPSGDVAPIPGMVVALWACAAPQPSRIMSDIAHAVRIESLQWCRRALRFCRVVQGFYGRGQR